MIKINLLRDIAGGGTQSEASNFGAAFAAASADTNNFDMGIKVAALIIPIVLILGYRQALVSRAQSRNADLKSQQRVIDQKLKSFDAQLKDVERFEEEKRKIDSQIKIIKDLSKERLKSVKSLDALQSLIPNSAWLTSLKFDKDDKVNLEGFAVNDVVVSEFMQQLSSSIFFSHVVLTSSIETATSEGSVKKFIIKCHLENI